MLHVWRSLLNHLDQPAGEGEPAKFCFFPRWQKQAEFIAAAFAGDKELYSLTLRFSQTAGNKTQTANPFYLSTAWGQVKGNLTEVYLNLFKYKEEFWNGLFHEIKVI